jgi:multiple sugar transport system ATP-binding protein
VTHDQIEAMTMADRIVVMHDGRVEQIGRPLDLYDRPDNLFVAQFIGSPAMNVVSGTVRREDGRAWLEADGNARWPIGTMPGIDGRPVVFGVRPEHLEIAQAGRDSVAGEVIVVEPTGAETELLVQVGSAQVTLVTAGRPNVRPGERIALAIESGMGHVFDRESGRRLGA